MPDANSIRLVPSVFHKGGEEGDFSWMLRQPAYDDALFIYNDNASQSAAYLKQVADGSVDPSSTACRPGAGNGAIRPYQCEDPPRAAGVPTGPDFDGLADEKRAIDDALEYVRTLLATGRYRQVIYSADSANDPGRLGHGTFAVPDDVLTYIPAQLKEIVDSANSGA